MNSEATFPQLDQNSISTELYSPKVQRNDFHPRLWKHSSHLIAHLSSLWPLCRHDVMTDTARAEENKLSFNYFQLKESKLHTKKVAADALERSSGHSSLILRIRNWLEMFPSRAFDKRQQTGRNRMEKHNNCNVFSAKLWSDLCKTTRFM